MPRTASFKKLGKSNRPDLSHEFLGYSAEPNKSKDFRGFSHKMDVLLEPAFTLHRNTKNAVQQGGLSLQHKRGQLL
jgi:hypothetical protein